VIIKGVVIVRVPNPTIKDRSGMWRYYQTLIKWKEDIFGPRAKKALEKKNLAHNNKFPKTES
jgi:hypothetical protein